MDPQKLEKAKALLQQAMALLDSEAGPTSTTEPDGDESAPMAGAGDDMAGKSIGMKMAKYRMGQ